MGGHRLGGDINREGEKEEYKTKPVRAIQSLNYCVINKAPKYFCKKHQHEQHPKLLDKTHKCST